MASAIKQVRANVVTSIQQVVASVLEQRDDNDPLTAEELPCVLVAERGSSIQQVEGQLGGTMTHTGLIQVAACSMGSSNSSARDQALDLLTLAINRLLSDFTLGGTVQEVRLVDYGGEDQIGSDVAAVPASFEVDFCTSNEDVGTLIY